MRFESFKGPEGRTINDVSAHMLSEVDGIRADAPKRQRTEREDSVSSHGSQIIDVAGLHHFEISKGGKTLAATVDQTGSEPRRHRDLHTLGEGFNASDVNTGDVTSVPDRGQCENAPFGTQYRIHLNPQDKFGRTVEQDFTSKSVYDNDDNKRPQYLPFSLEASENIDSL